MILSILILFGYIGAFSAALSYRNKKDALNESIKPKMTELDGLKKESQHLDLIKDKLTELIQENAGLTQELTSGKAYLSIQPDAGQLETLRAEIRSLQLELVSVKVDYNKAYVQAKPLIDAAEALRREEQKKEQSRIEAQRKEQEELERVRAIKRRKEEDEERVAAASIYSSSSSSSSSSDDSGGSWGGGGGSSSGGGASDGW